ncbi:MAG: DUF4097 family beta strand repeat protein [Gemmatimonadetes bacterium]|jgi:DUF4097 and DUF4098 domain-containing protein YvlB|nr:DUF4097 family beta strand repeat protein [Gemmatimonadota bacterium]MBP6669762.1 DUF4097 family beta strand repeat protein [Gemmatimonadales bacterium]MBK6781639.1 DUF4097 family beta strand repeat protein [Gemmatimonadota bacterium]MBK7350068.1 DUF4097 family beta strand repeat protein [Gemmatimonadota bacterium]MBK7715683.1 DUF4097 family beta strand repeat protein [Gemmatimonadota bacterium]
MLTLLLALATVPQGTDTTIAVRGATRLELSSFEGAITVATWNRPSVRIQADHDEDTRVEVNAGARSLRVRAHSRYGPPEVTWRLTVPADLTLDLASQSGDIRVSGTRGEVNLSTVEGNVTVQGGVSFVSVQSVEGDLDISDVDGRVNLSTVDGGITVRGARGELRANAVDGAIRLADVRATRVDASTVDGEIEFTGVLEAGGRYHLTSHDGDVTVTVPTIDAEVSVSTFSGEFESDFPVTVTGAAGGRRLSFTLGTGAARLELESFDGTVALRRSGSPR